MTRASKPVRCALAALLAGCAASDPRPDMSAVHELASLERTGALDVQRAECAAVALVGEMEVWYAGLPTDAERDLAEARAMEEHARSVQASMRGAERSNRAANRAARATRRAVAVARSGNPRVTAGAFSHAARLRSATHAALPGTRVVPPLPDATREGAAAFVHYVRIKGVLAIEDRDDPALLEDGRILEAEHPEVVPAYASVLLDAYRAPDLTCTTIGG